MDVCIAYMNNKAIILSLKDNIAYIDDEAHAIKGITEEDLKEFVADINAIPYSTDPGYKALLNSKRAVFLMKLVGQSVGDETVDKLSRILDSVHFEVLEYLGETSDS